MTFEFTGKSVLVTGAAHGFGRSIALSFAKCGAQVTVCDIAAAGLAETAQLVGGLSLVLDVGKRAAVQAALAGQAYDILVNNAGVTRDNLFIRMKDEEWDQVLRVNLDSAFYLTRAAVKNMMRRRFGRVIFITSVVGSMGNPGQANYAASKAAISAMAKSVGQEVASRNITLNCIAPGFIQTPMTDVLNEKQTEAMLQRIPAGRYGTPDEVASTAVFLASNEAAYVTGQTVHVNGGMIMI